MASGGDMASTAQRERSAATTAPRRSTRPAAQVSQRPIDVTPAAGALAGSGADIGAHRGHRVGLAGQDVALLEPAFGGEIEVAPAIGADGTGLLALDVALKPGCVDRLDEELLVRIESQVAVVPFLLGRMGGM